MVISQNLLWFILKDICTIEKSTTHKELIKINISNLHTEFEDRHVFGNDKDIIARLYLSYVMTRAKVEARHGPEEEGPMAARLAKPRPAPVWPWAAAQPASRPGCGR